VYSSAAESKFEMHFRDGKSGFKPELTWQLGPSHESSRARNPSRSKTACLITSRLTKDQHLVSVDSSKVTKHAWELAGEG